MTTDARLRALEREAATDPAAAELLLRARQRVAGCCRGTGWRRAWERCPCGLPPSVEDADRWVRRTVARIDAQIPARFLAAQRERWLRIGLATGPSDRPLAEAGVRLAYAAAGRPPPEAWIWLGDPLRGGMAYSLLADPSVGASVGDSVRASVWASVRASVRDSVWASVGASVGASVRDSVWASVGASVRDSVGASVRDSVRASVWASVRDSVWDSVRDSVRASVRASVGASVGASVRASVGAAIYGSHESHWLGFHETFLRLGLRAPERLRGLSWVAQAAGWWWPFDRAVILTERPAEITPERIVYPSGWEVVR